MKDELKILEALRSESKPSVRRIGQITHIPKSTVHDLLGEMHKKLTIKHVVHTSSCNWIACWGAANQQELPLILKLRYVNNVQKMYGDWFFYQCVFPNKAVLNKYIKKLDMHILFYGSQELKFQEAKLI